jgi:hypothetical protein
MVYKIWRQKYHSHTPFFLEKSSIIVITNSWFITDNSFSLLRQAHSHIFGRFKTLKTTAFAELT